MLLAELVFALVTKPSLSHVLSAANIVLNDVADAELAVPPPAALFALSALLAPLAPDLVSSTVHFNTSESE